jgi:hypothetical protein
MSPKRLLLALCVASLTNAQTQTQLDALRSYLQSIQNKAAASLAVINSPSRPTNWKELVIVDLSVIESLVVQTRATMSQVTTRSTSVPAGMSLQEALNAAQPGDTLILTAGAEYRGNFILPQKIGTGMITITSSRLSELPGEGQRVTPANRSAMPRLVSPNDMAALATAPGAHHYRIVGVELTTAPGMYNGGIVRFGHGSETIATALPHDIELDRVYIHGDATVGSKRGVALNGKALTVRNSWISDFKSSIQDAQAICGWNGPGPFAILNNYLEATGENIMFGGSEPALAGVTPSDITIAGNHIRKPLQWRGTLGVKNLLELKTGRRVLISGNIIENNWLSLQIGYAIVIKPGSENIKTPAITSDITISNNIVRHAAGGINVVGNNTTGGYVRTLSIRNNLFDDLGTNWGSALSLFTLQAGVTGIIIENNTAMRTTLNTALQFDGAPASSCLIRSNIVDRGDYGFKGSGYAEGTATMNKYCPASTVTNNVIYGPGSNSALYPALNYFPLSEAEIGWQNATGGDLQLSAYSLYKAKGAGGRDPGVDYAALAAATADTLSGR